MTRVRGGFALTEVVISILILSTLSVILVGVIPATIIGAKSAAHRATASMLARQTMEVVKRDGFENLVSKSMPDQTIQTMLYTIDVVVGKATGSDGSELDDTMVKQVTVTVRWTYQKKQLEYRAVTNVYSIP